MVECGELGLGCGTVRCGEEVIANNKNVCPTEKGPKRTLRAFLAPDTKNLSQHLLTLSYGDWGYISGNLGITLCCWNRVGV